MTYEYAIPAVASAVGVVLLEKKVWKTGLFRSPSYWFTMGICLFFMVLVNGWLTKLSAPIVRYDPDQKTPWRFPWDIPVEDYFFGFALLNLVLLLWVRQDGPDDPAPWRRGSETAASDEDGGASDEDRAEVGTTATDPGSGGDED